MFFALDDARAGDEKEFAGTDVDVADLEWGSQFKTFLTQRTPRSQRKTLQNISEILIPSAFSAISALNGFSYRRATLSGR